MQRGLVRGEPFSTVGPKLVGCRSGDAADRTYEGGDDLTPLFVGDTDDRDFGHTGVGVEDVFDLAGVDVLASPDDHVFDPALDAQVAAIIHGGQVPGVVPAVGVDRRHGRIGGSVVAVHDQIAAGAELADLAERDGLAGGGIGDLHLGLGQRLAERLGTVGGGVVQPGLGKQR